MHVQTAAPKPINGNWLYRLPPRPGIRKVVLVRCENLALSFDVVCMYGIYLS